MQVYSRNFSEAKKAYLLTPAEPPLEFKSAWNVRAYNNADGVAALKKERLP